MFKKELLSPPGMNLVPWKNFTLWSAVLSTVFSLIYYLNRLLRSLDTLYIPRTRELIEGALMPGFFTVVKNSLDIFPVLAAVMVLFALVNYLYFFQESKSIYTMRRIKSPWELHIRCWALPLCGSAFMIGCRWALMLICFAIYMLATPAEALPPELSGIFGR